MSDLNSNMPSGQDSIKGGIFFGSSLTPGGSFSNVPQTTSAAQPSEEQEAKVVLTLQQVKEDLQKQAAAKAGTTDDVLSETAVNTFLQSYVQLLIDYRDMRNFVFFGSAYTELSYHINYLITNFPYQAFFAKDVGLNSVDPTNGISLLTMPGNTCKITFEKNDVLQASVFAFDNSGVTNWTKYDLVDKNGSRFPIVSVAFTTNTLTITDATNASPIVTTTSAAHGLNNGDIVTINGVLGNTAANGTFTIDNVTATTFELVGSTGTGVYTLGGEISLNRIEVIVAGTISTNNFIEQEPSTGVLYKGLLISPKLKTINDFNSTIDAFQKSLINPTNPTPWPRAEITNNLITSGSDFDAWTTNPSNMSTGYDADTMGLITDEPGSTLSLTAAFTLDDTITNQLLRRAIPHRLVDEIRDTDDKFFTRFVLLAGKLFDTIKVYIDFLKYTKEINYTPFNQLSPEFFRAYAEHYGFDLFDDENIGLAKAIINTEPGLSYDNQNNAVYNNAATERTVKDLQNEKQKRLLVNLFYLYSTKGTLKCIETLAKLLGAPDGLVVFEEQAYNSTTKQKVVENEKVKVPQIAYEIDPDFLVNANDVNDPVNLPYVYRLKLDNNNIVNLRELNGYTDPQGAVQQQILEFGKSVYAYGHFENGSFATLQNHAAVGGYYLLPLTFPDRYCGITVEYMLPRDGFTKGVGQNLDEAAIHLGSLFLTEEITYTDNQPDKLSATNNYAHRLPQSFMEGVISNNNVTPVPYKAEFTIQGNSPSPGSDVMQITVDGVPIGDTTTLSTKKRTALAIVNAINFSAANDEYVAYYKENAGGASFTITIESRPEFTVNILPTPVVEVLINGSPAPLISFVDANFITMDNGAGTFNNGQFIIARLEGKDLVVRCYLRSENVNFTAPIQRVAILTDVFNTDGLNHELRLIYRPEGVEVYQDFKYLGLAAWRDSLTMGKQSISCPKNVIDSCTVKPLPDIFAYPDDETTTSVGVATPATGKITINALAGTVNDIVVLVDGQPVNIAFNSVGQTPAQLAIDIETAINAETASTGVMATSSGSVVNIIEDLTFLYSLNGKTISITMDNAAGVLNYTSISMSGGHDPAVDGANPGFDKPRWWDLFIGMPTNVDMFFKRVSVHEQPSINHPDTIDFGIDTSGMDVEKFSFNFINQLQTAGEYVVDGIAVSCDYRSPSPFAANALLESDAIDLTFGSYSNNLVTDLRLVSQTYIRGGKARFSQDIQNYFTLPNGTVITIDSLFKFNGWSYSLHKDYAYTNFNKVYNNYEIFSQQVLTYLTLLPFMELVEDKFKKLISQFIPIVINISKFGRLVRQLEKQKVHYPNIHRICGASVIGCDARGSFRITHGSNNAYAELNNNLTIKIQITKFIVDASNATPIVITTATPHNFANGNSIDITGVNGNNAANGNWVIANVTPTTFELDSSTGSGAYVSGGMAIHTPLNLGTFDWYGSNALTAADVYNNLLAWGSYIVPTVDENVVTMDIDTDWFIANYTHDINDCDLVIETNANVQVDQVSGFDGGYPSVVGNGCFEITATNNIPLPTGNPDQYIYNDAEQALETYIYFESELGGSGPYTYIN